MELEVKRMIHNALVTHFTPKAQRLVASGLVEFASSNRYYVYPVVFEVQRRGRTWLCQCEHYSRYRFCEHILAVQIQEAQKT